MAGSVCRPRLSWSWRSRWQFSWEMARPRRANCPFLLAPDYLTLINSFDKKVHLPRNARPVRVAGSAGRARGEWAGMLCFQIFTHAVFCAFI